MPAGRVVIRAKHELYVRITTLVRENELLPVRVHFVDFQRVNIHSFRARNIVIKSSWKQSVVDGNLLTFLHEAERNIGSIATIVYVTLGAISIELAGT